MTARELGGALSALQVPVRVRLTLLDQGWPGWYGQAAVRVNVGQAKTDLSKLIARVEAGFDVEIARDGTPVARLVPIDRTERPGTRFLAAKGVLAGKIRVSEDFEFSEEELDAMLDQ